ncbi:sodium-dependent glucose transporter 1A-like [Pecten maximus]|uniref:sodium-dependent glucose transporter 1A-like n=1 Tax=Pecten maximus TaxID=6579 RepID=UPI001458C1B0|nr:sodium-dependent glucose transporter 1A-like [Pecten maximus]XP_033745894.1 sodium-dependent glucose transporter 1A-like [Pecten maximus]
MERSENEAGVNGHGYPCQIMDKTHRKKVYYSICIYAAFFSIGWMRGLYGPALVDILFISDVSLDLGSLVFTFNSIGYIFGCLGGKYLAGRWNRNMLYGLNTLALGILIGVTPWCYLFVLMVAVHFGQGTVTGIIDTVGNIEILSLWSNDRKMFFFLELMFVTGTFVSPFVAAPFLLDTDASVHVFNDSLNEQSETQQWNTTDTLSTQSSHLYIPYTLTACLNICICLPFFVFSLKHYLRNIKTSHEVEATDTKKSLPSKYISCFVVICSSLLFLGMALGEGFISYLAVYCVEQLSFTTSEGAVISSISGGCSIAAVVVSLFVTSLNTLVYLGIHVVGTLSGVGFFLVCSLVRFTSGVWLLAGVIGYFRTMIFSLTLSWTNEYITQATSTIVSIYMVSTSAGCALVPILLGKLMETYTNQWFCYMFLILGTLVLLLYILGVILTKKVVMVYGKTNERENDCSRPESEPLALNAVKRASRV